jgi:hypothetical protein
VSVQPASYTIPALADALAAHFADLPPRASSGD